jgi:putative transposase
MRGPAFWLSVFTELHHRGLKHIFLAWCDALTGFPEASEAVYPHTRVQLCLVHMVRRSLKDVATTHRKEVAADLKLIYSAPTEAEAGVYLDLCAEKWDRLYPTLSRLWRTHWGHVIPLVAFPADMR